MYCYLYSFLSSAFSGIKGFIFSRACLIFFSLFWNYLNKYIKVVALVFVKLVAIGVDKTMRLILIYTCGFCWAIEWLRLRWTWWAAWRQWCLISSWRCLRFICRLTRSFLYQYDFQINCLTNYYYLSIKLN